MLLKESGIKIEKSGEFETSDFRIKASAKAFKILSSQLYQNKISAIVRELSCNAYDSHIMAGKSDKKFDVHLPNILEPWFSIRDYGVGLSHEDIINIYTTYFESTKTTSNDYVGCLGLGSKTPFSYTDMFSVTSYFNGVKRVYSAYIADAGFPAISLLTEDSTDELNGLYIEMSVQKQDFQEFLSTAEKIYRYFDNTPNITGNNLKLDKPEKVLEGKNFYRAICNSYYNNSSVAIMGNVAYPINISSFFYNELTKNQKNILNMKLHILFDIGELEVTPSREALSYDEYTKKQIIKKLNLIYEELKQLINEELKLCKNNWEKNCLSNEIRHNKKYDGISNLDFLSFDRSYFNLVEKNILPSNIFSVRPGYIQKTKRTKTTTIPYYKEIIFVYDDLEKGALSRVQYAVAKTKKTHYLINCDKKTLDLLIKELDCEPSLFVKASSLDKRPPPQRIKSQKYSKEQVYEVSSDGGYPPVEIDINDGGLFIPIHNNSVIKNDNLINNSHPISWFVNKLRLTLKELNIKEKIYLFRKATVKKINSKKYKGKKWTNAIDFIKSEIDKKYTDKDFEYTSFICEYKDDWKPLYKCNDKNILQILEKIDSIKKQEDRYSKNISNFILFKKGNNVFDNSIEKLEREIIKKYPLLEIVFSKYGWKDNLTSVLEYISLKENK